MELIRVEEKEYSQFFPTPLHIFNSTPFSLLNKNKAEELFFLLFKDTKVRLGIIFGKRSNVLFSPFSAPFGGFSYVKNDISIERIETSIQLLQEYSDKNNLSIQITLPPLFYSQSFLSKTINSFLRSDFKIKYADINHSLQSYIVNNYKDYIKYNARKNLKTAAKYRLKLIKAEDEESTKLAYSIIQQNRESKNYPLKMSFEEVLKTTEIITADFFNLYYNDESIASAQVFYVTKKIVQIIYWGDKPGVEHMRPMNALANELLKFYNEKGIEWVDIGPSAEYGIPNYGLADFKESIGCVSTNKYTFIYE